ncbi:hypothetical protein ACP8Y2_05405 [Herpetosiphon llansteffanensis]
MNDSKRILQHYLFTGGHSWQRTNPPNQATTAAQQKNKQPAAQAIAAIVASFLLT